MRAPSPRSFSTLKLTYVALSIGTILITLLMRSWPTHLRRLSTSDLADTHRTSTSKHRGCMSSSKW
jgi:hypothetical protein